MVFWGIDMVTIHNRHKPIMAKNHVGMDVQQTRIKLNGAKVFYVFLASCMTPVPRGTGVEKIRVICEICGQIPCPAMRDSISCFFIPRHTMWL